MAGVVQKDRECLRYGLSVCLSLVSLLRCEVTILEGQPLLYSFPGIGLREPSVCMKFLGTVHYSNLQSVCFWGRLPE